MQLTNKKYFSIAEAAAATGIPRHKLRYLEKSVPGMQIFQIRGRRYYTQGDIDLIKQKFISNAPLALFSPAENPNSEKITTDFGITDKIDALIHKFRMLEESCL